MKTLGSAVNETLKEAGLKFECNDIRGCKIFKDKQTGKLELYRRRSTPISGYQIKYKGAYYEFCGSVDNKPNAKLHY